MDVTAARDYLLTRALSIDSEQFEQLCKMLIERAEQTQSLELTPFRGDGGIDVHAVIDRELFHARLGVQAKQYQPGNTVGARTIRSFKGALSDQSYHIGTVMTTSSFTSGAIESAERDFIRLIDGEMLTEIMLESELGVIETGDGTYESDHAFWELFEKPEHDDTIPSIEVPQADNFDIIRLVLEAVDHGADTKPEITHYLETHTGDDWDPRQADYYGMAGWLLGFLHKEQNVETDTGTVRRWGLTREGEEYLELLDRDEQTAANERLYDAVRTVAIISRVYDVLQREQSLERHEIADLVAAESAVSGSTVDRRALTIGRWLMELPEVRSAGRGRTQTYTYLGGNLTDFS